MTACNLGIAALTGLHAFVLADVSKRDGQGRLPIHLAAMHKNGEVAVAAIRLLAQAPGFDANARRSKEEQGATALHTAALRRTDGGSATTAIIEALLAAGAGVCGNSGCLTGTDADGQGSSSPSCHSPTSCTPPSILRRCERAER